MKKNIAFMSSDLIGVPLLEWLHSNSGLEFNLTGVITHPDKESGRGKKLTPNPIALFAQNNGITVLKPNKPGPNEVQWLKENQIDLVLVIAYGHILKDDFLAAPRVGLVNFHTSLLPKYRGPSPIETAIAEGETQTGISLMEIVKKMDAGGIVDTQTLPIECSDTRITLREKIALACVPLLKRNLKKLLSGDFQLTPQDEARVSFTRMLYKEDGLLDFSLPARKLEARIRAMTPWPGGFFEFNDTIIKVQDCEVFDHDSTEKPGTVIASSNTALDVQTSEGVLRIKKLQRPGGKMLPANDFLRGFTIQVGDFLKGGNALPLVSSIPFKRKKA